MSSKLVPSDPSDVMVIRNVTPNVVTLSVPFLRFGRLRVGGRATIVKLTSGSLAVVSPVALTADVKAKVTELGGDVKYLIAPDIEHHIFISEWATAYPGAKIIGPEGLPEKREKVTDDPKIGNEKFTTVFRAAEKATTRIDEQFDADFDIEYVDAHPSKELVLFYKPDKVLIEADLMFNLPAVEQYSRVPNAGKEGLLSSIFSSIQSTAGEAKSIKRFTWYILSKNNRTGFNESINRIYGWDFTTIIPCHGDTIEKNAKEVFEKVFEWHLTAKN